LVFCAVLLAACQSPVDGDEAQSVPRTRFEGAVGESFTGATIRGYAEARIGSALGCGDFDADGRDDLIIGTPYDSTRVLEGGGAVVFRGPLIGSLSLDDADLVIRGDRRFAAAGFSVAGLGDINGDDIGDFAVGAYADTLAGDVKGSEFVFEGPLQPGDIQYDAAAAWHPGDGW